MTPHDSVEPRNGSSPPAAVVNSTTLPSEANARMLDYLRGMLPTGNRAENETTIDALTAALDRFGFSVVRQDSDSGDGASKQ